jgi:hypothetical protein
MWGQTTNIRIVQGYQGIKKIHNSSYTPIKKTNKKSLTLSEKDYNRELAKHRI